MGDSSLDGRWLDGWEKGGERTSLGMGIEIGRGRRDVENENGKRLDQAHGTRRRDMCGLDIMHHDRMGR